MATGVIGLISIIVLSPVAEDDMKRPACVTTLQLHMVVIRVSCRTIVERELLQKLKEALVMSNLVQVRNVAIYSGII